MAEVVILGTNIELEEAKRLEKAKIILAINLLTKGLLSENNISDIFWE
jgi:hypothetical protein